jgi:hypothetical protein
MERRNGRPAPLRQAWLYRPPQARGVDENHARAHAEAVEAALRESVATKSDILRLEARIELAVRDMTRRMWTIAIALFAALVLIKFFG